VVEAAARVYAWRPNLNLWMAVAVPRAGRLTSERETLKQAIPMRTTAGFFAYLFGCFALAAVLTYPLVELGGLAGWVGGEPERLMARLTQVFILLGFWPLLRWLHLADRESLGYGVAPGVLLRALAVGWLLGVAILLVQAIVLLQLHVLVPSAPPGWFFLVRKAGLAVATGLLVGLLEETFFRGALFYAIRRREGLVPAVIWSAALYAAAHFLKPGALPAGTPFDWSGAFMMATRMFSDSLAGCNLDSMAAIFAAGVLLALVRERTGHLGWCIGLHAGWVFVIQVTRRLTDVNPQSGLTFLVGGYDDFIGWLATAWIGVLAVVYWYGSGFRGAE
jgi:uncharacterized protein